MGLEQIFQSKRSFPSRKELIQRRFMGKTEANARIKKLGKLLKGEMSQRWTNFYRLAFVAILC